MHEDIDYILISEAELQAKVRELGARLAQEYASSRPVFLGVLNGAMLFLSDLVRACPIHLTVDTMAISSYGGATTSSGAVKILKDLDRDIEGREVVIVEDIVDTGLTLSYLIEYLRNRRPARLRICTLLDKHDRRTADLTLDHVGFVVPDVFVVGYGLDFADEYRNLPYLGVLKPERYS